MYSKFGIVGGLKNAEGTTMKVNDAVSRLVRAGDENSAMWEKIREAIDEFVKTLIHCFPEQSSYHRLPKGYMFIHQSDGDYELSGFEAKITSTIKNRQEILAFAKHIQNGLLHEIVDQLDNEAQFLDKTTSALKNFCISRR